MNKIIGGLKQRKLLKRIDPRNFDYQKSFGAIDINLLPKEGLDRKPTLIKDQRLLDFCSLFAAAAVREDTENIQLNPLMTWAYAAYLRGDYKSWGIDLETTRKAVCKFGFIEEKDSPFNADMDRDFLAQYKNYPPELAEKAKEHKAESGFWIGYKPNFFDAIRIALYQHREKNLSVLTGCEFAFSWLQNEGGIINSYDKNEQKFGHAIKCCHPDTNILTKDGYKDIPNVKINDFVLTRDGYKKVLKTFKRNVNEDIYEIDNNLGLNNLKITKEHPVLIRKSSPTTKLSWYIKAKTFYSKLEFTEIQNIKRGDFIVSIIDDKVKKNKISKDFARLLGYYIGDGNLTNEKHKNGSVYNNKFRLTYSRANKKNLVEDLIKIVKKYDKRINYSIYEDKKSNTNCITFYSTSLSKEISKYCGFAKNKFISQELLYMGKEKQIELLRGWFLTDGSGKWLGKDCGIFTSEKKLAQSLLFLLQRNRLIYNIFNVKPKQNVKFSNGIYNTKGGYQIGFHSPQKRDNIKYDKNYLISRIYNIKKNKYKGEVYNLEIEDKNEYLANNILVHNCYDWKIINNETYLVAQLSNGNIGDNGLMYFSKNVINSPLFRFDGLMFIDENPMKIKAAQWNILAQILDKMVKILQLMQKQL